MAKPTKTPKPKRTFADIAASYKRYDLEKEGYGSTAQWQRSFNVRMGFEEAKRIINQQERTPWDILGISENASSTEIKSAYRAKAMQFHPDRVRTTGLDEHAAEEAFKQIQAAYQVMIH